MTRRRKHKDRFLRTWVAITLMVVLFGVGIMNRDHQLPAIMLTEAAIVPPKERLVIVVTGQATPNDFV